ncbi:MAG: ATP-binding protein [Opitutales bacterium]
MKDTFHRLLDPITMNQDYVWFLCVLIWLWIVIRSASNAPSIHSITKWPLQLGVTAILISLTSVIRQIFPPENVVFPPREFEIISKLLLGIALAVMARALIHNKAWIAWIILCIGFTWDLANPAIPGENPPLAFGTSTLASLVFSVLLGTKALRKDYAFASLLSLTGLAVLFHPEGIWAEMSHESRRWTESSLFSIPYALCWLLAGIQTSRLIEKPLRESNASNKLIYTVDRRILAGWLLVGFVLTYFAGYQTKQSFESGLLARSEAYAYSLNRPLLEEWMKNKFELGAKQELRNFIGPVSIYDLPALADPDIQDLRSFYGNIETKDKDIVFAHFATIENNELIAAVLPTDDQGAHDVTIMHRIINADDIAALSEKISFVRGPETLPWGSLVGAWVPVFNENEEVLGWSVIHTTASIWLAFQAQSRLQALALVGIGAVVIFLIQRNRERRSETEHAQQQAQFESQAHAMKSRLMAQVSHELRTPIQSIVGYNELLQTVIDDGQKRNWLEAQELHSSQLLRLVNDLIDSSSLESGKFKLQVSQVTIEETFKTPLSTLQSKATEKGLDFVVDFPDTKKTVLWDSVRVRQILENLVSNAIKFTDTGQICIHLETGVHDSSQDFHRLTIIDTGPGISEDKLESIFQPFERLSNKKHVDGIGLGLFIAQTLCQLMGGEVKVKSSPGSGSSFEAKWLSSKHISNQNVSDAQKMISLNEKRLKGRRVLLAEDNDIIAELLSQILIQQGAELTRVDNGKHAFDELMDGAFEVAILDISMPQKSGIEVTRQIREIDKQLRIVGVSAHAGETEKLEAMNAGMDQFLAKPVSVRNLIGAVSPGGDDNSLNSNDSSYEFLRKQLMSKFYQETSEIAIELSQALESKDWDLLYSKSHYAKGAALLLKADAIADCCDRINQASSGRSVELAKEGILSLNNNLKDR